MRGAWTPEEERTKNASSTGRVGFIQEISYVRTWKYKVVATRRAVLAVNFQTPHGDSFVRQVLFNISVARYPSAIWPQHNDSPVPPRSSKRMPFKKEKVKALEYPLGFSEALNAQSKVWFASRCHHLKGCEGFWTSFKGFGNFKLVLYNEGRMQDRTTSLEDKKGFYPFLTTQTLPLPSYVEETPYRLGYLVAKEAYKLSSWRV